MRIAKPMQNVCGQAKEEVFPHVIETLSAPWALSKELLLYNRKIFKATKKQLTEDLEAIAKSRLKPFSCTDVGRLLVQRSL